MRYTECRLARISDELLAEIDQDTVPFRPNYDGTKTEPVVLPARLPNLLVNGATGIAVGMATNIPPHNLGEVCQALLKLLDNPDLSTAQLCRCVKGPDFPTGGQILNSADELKEIYRTGSGTVRLRGTWETGRRHARRPDVFITSIPYTVNKATLVERIAEVVIERKLPPLVDVRDVSTDDVRIELEIKKDADPQAGDGVPVQAHAAADQLRRQPDLPGADREPRGRPARAAAICSQILWHFLHFRLEVVTRAARARARRAEKRIHILEGFEKVFDALDEIMRIIRKSDGKADAAAKIMKRFEPRRRADRRDPRAQALPPGPARDPRHPATSWPTSASARRQISGLLADEEDRWSVVRERARGDLRRPTATRRPTSAARSTRDGRRGRVSPPTTSSSTKTTSSSSRATAG